MLKLNSRSVKYEEITHTDVNFDHLSNEDISIHFFF